MSEVIRQTVPFEQLVEFHDRRRIPLSKRERADRSGPFPYYGAQGIIDWLDDFIFDGRYLLIAEDGENLNSRKQPVAFVADGRFWVNNHAHVVKAIDGLADDDFLRAYVEFHPLNGLITGAAQPKLSQSNLKRLQVAAPPYPAQARIGSVIRALDDLIENNRRRVEILEEMARLLYWEWFVHFRFPRHEDVELVDSELGRIPEGWEVGRVGDCLTLQRGFDLPVRDRNEAGAVPVLAASGFHGRHDEIRVDGPGVVTGRSGTIGRSFLVHEDFWPLNTVLWAKEFKLGGPAFAHGLLESIDLTRVAGGAAVPTLNRNHLHAMSHVVPPAALASTYCDAVDPLHDLRANLEDQNELLRETRDLLLPRLVSGELDVSEPDLDSVLA